MTLLSQIIVEFIEKLELLDPLCHFEAPNVIYVTKLSNFRENEEGRAKHLRNGL